MDAGTERSGLSIHSRSSAAAGSELSVVVASARAYRYKGPPSYPGNFPRFPVSHLGSHPTLADRVADQVRRVVNVELLHQAATMEFGGFHADVQHFGDLLGRFPFSDELQDLAFPGGEMRARAAVIVWRSAGVYDGLGGSGADVEPAAPNLFNRLY